MQTSRSWVTIRGDVSPVWYICVRLCVCVAGLENDEYIRQIEGYLPTAEVRQATLNTDFGHACGLPARTALTSMHTRMCVCVYTGSIH